MCLIIFSWQPDSQRPLILAANRDEFHARESRDAHFWEDIPSIFGGRDMEKKGSWLALSKQKDHKNYRFACLTNFRNPNQNSYPLSRGEIVSNFLINQIPAIDYAKNLPFDQHAGFNALFLDGKELVYCHHNGSEDPIFRNLSAGVYGISNAQLDTPWPKLVKTKKAFNTLDPAGPSEKIADHLFMSLKDKEIAADETLPDTGVGILLERMLSSAFIISPDYGTRTSTALIIERNNSKEHIYFEERQFSSEGIQSRQLVRRLD